MIDNKKTTFKGFELFNDIEDRELRTRNQAVVLTNISEDNSRNRLISPKGVALILGYFQQIFEGDRDIVKTKYKDQMNQRGFKIVA
jgi:hypothetical protein